MHADAHCAQVLVIKKERQDFTVEHLTEKQIMCRWTLVAGQVVAVRKRRVQRVLRGGREVSLMLIRLGLNVNLARYQLQAALMLAR